MLPETIESVIAELDSAIHYENKPAQQQYRNSINIIDFKQIIYAVISCQWIAESSSAMTAVRFRQP